jgi:hypothetical protein
VALVRAAVAWRVGPRRDMRRCRRLSFYSLLAAPHLCLRLGSAFN